MNNKIKKLLKNDFFRTCRKEHLNGIFPQMIDSGMKNKKPSTWKKHNQRFQKSNVLSKIGLGNENEPLT